MAHSKLSPSSAHRWALCPGSIREEAKYPGDTSSPAAIDGTHTHTLLEQCIIDFPVSREILDPMSFVGETLEDHEGEFVVDEDRAARVVVAIRYINSRLTVPTSLFAEKIVNPGAWFNREDMPGTADVQIVQDGVFEVIDYKDGMHPVSPENNLQLILYALGAIHPYCKDGKIPFNTITLTIIQPKLAVKGMPAISHWVITAEELFEHVEELRVAAEKTDDPAAPLVPGESQCKWCNAKGGCDALAGKALQEAQVLFGELDMAKQAANNDPALIDNDKLVQIIEAKPLITEFLAAAEAEALRRIQNGQSVPGLKVVRGRGSRNWKLEDDEMEAKLKSLGIPKTALHKVTLISPAQAENLKWEKKVKGEVVTKSLSERQIKTMKENFIENKPGRLTVVPDSDSRKSVTTDAASLFATVEASPALPGWLS